MGSKKLAKNKDLTPSELLFCKLYACDKEFMGNGVKCYLEVFDNKDNPVKYNSAKANAGRLLTKDNILVEVQKLFDKHILSDVEVDQELAYIIKQHGNLQAKVSGIKEYNILKGRIKAGDDNRNKLITPVIIIERVAGAEVDRFESTEIEGEIVIEKE